MTSTTKRYGDIVCKKRCDRDGGYFVYLLKEQRYLYIKIPNTNTKHHSINEES